MFGNIMDNFVLQLNPATAALVQGKRNMLDREALSNFQKQGGEFNADNFYDPQGAIQQIKSLDAFKQYGQAKESLPVEAQANTLNRMSLTDPVVGSPEGLKDFAARPEFWLSKEEISPDRQTRTVTPPNMANPYIAKDVNDFAVKAGNTALTGDVLSPLTRTPENVAKLIQSNPEHFASNVKQATGILPQPADTGTKQLADFAVKFTGKMPEIKDIDGLYRAFSETLKETGADWQTPWASPSPASSTRSPHGKAQASLEAAGRAAVGRRQGAAPGDQPGRVRGPPAGL